jgi:hypothetical protein
MQPDTVGDGGAPLKPDNSAFITPAIISPAEGAPVHGAEPGVAFSVAVAVEAENATVDSVELHLESLVTPAEYDALSDTWRASVRAYEAGSLALSAVAHGILQGIVKGPTTVTSAPVHIAVTLDSATPVFQITVPISGTAFDVPESGKTIQVAATTSDQFGQRWLTVSWDNGRTAALAPQSSPTLYGADIALAPMPLGARMITVTCRDQRFTVSQTVSVTAIDDTPPRVTVTQPADNQQFIAISANGGAPQATLLVDGMATDTQGGMAVGTQATVQVASSASGPRITATPTAGDFSHWTAQIPVTGVGTHILFVWAVDALGNALPAPLQRQFQLVDSYVPKTLADRTNGRQYLAALQSFASEQISTDPSNDKLTTDALVQVLGQPVDRLSEPLTTAATVGTIDVNQLRVPIELLRAYIAQHGYPTATGAAGEAAYRAAAYASLLSGFGTSLPEIQLARGAADTDRAALAARLGIALTAPRPDQLDALLLDGDALTEAALEAVFGLEDTTGADVLRPPPTGRLLAWQHGALAAAWAVEDAAPVLATTFHVLVDPDVVSVHDIIASSPPTAAIGLQSSRATDLAAYAAKLQTARAGAATPAAGLAAIIAIAAQGLDISALTTAESTANDITATLGGFFLDVAGFRYLQRFSALATGVTPTDGEWSAVVDIFTGAYKRSQFPAWRTAEAGLSLSPDLFQIADASSSVSSHRVDPRARVDWEAVLRSRTAVQRGLDTAAASVVAATEQTCLPLLRDALLADILAGETATSPQAGTNVQPTPMPPAPPGPFQARVLQGRTPRPNSAARMAAPGLLNLLNPTPVPVPPSLDTVAEEMTAWFQIDVKAGGNVRTTRLGQATESLQTLLFAVRAGELPDGHPAKAWTLVALSFDAGWTWMGTYGTWQAATLAFLFPERHLDPTLLLSEPAPTPSAGLVTLWQAISAPGEFTPEQADAAARMYLNISGDPRSLLRAQASVVIDREPMWAVPMLLAQRLQAGGNPLAALDWYRLLYPYDDPAKPSIYATIRAELSATPAAPDLTQPTGWTSQLDPFTLAGNRPAPYTRYTLLAIARCHIEYGDEQFTTETDESIARARSLYLTALRLLAHPRLQPFTPANVNEPALPIPELAILAGRADAQLAKIRKGCNIAGMPRVQGAPSATLIAQPTPYRFKVLLERAKQLATQATQFESQFLTALEKYDQKTLQQTDAANALGVAQAQVAVAAAKLTEATDSVAAAQAQKTKATTMAAAYQAQADAGPNQYEQAMLDGYGDIRTANDLIAGADTAIGILQATANAASSGLATFGAGVAINSAETIPIQIKGAAQVWLNDLQYQQQTNQLKSSIAQQRTQWQLQQAAAAQDALVADAQITTARDRVAVASQENGVAQAQANAANATLQFITTQFTNADLYNWMSQVLGGVYRDGLQQATAVARLAQTQLAFERAEAAQTIVRANYTQSPGQLAPKPSNTDRKALTGAEQLDDDLNRLDAYAFTSDRRNLNVTQTLSLATLAPVDFVAFKSTGVLEFATPTSLFDADFPGHYLRLVKRIRVSLVALVPPTRGIRAELLSNGISRVTVPQDIGFTEVTLRQDPGAISFTSPAGATGVFELDAQPDMLLPFEGAGVDTTWELRLPRPANPFDYGAIADVLISIDYTARADDGYRTTVVTALNNDLTRGGDLVFSLARDFPDQWYALNNPDPAATPGADRSVTLTLTPADFPTGITGLDTAGVAVALVGPAAAANPVKITLGRDTTSADAQTLAGIAGTRRGNAPAWLMDFVGPRTDGRSTAPTGDWTLTLHTDADNLLDTGGLSDLLLVISWSGTGPSWPA